MTLQTGRPFAKTLVQCLTGMAPGRLTHARTLCSIRIAMVIEIKPLETAAKRYAVCSLYSVIGFDTETGGMRWLFHTPCHRF